MIKTILSAWLLLSASVLWAEPSYLTFPSDIEWKQKDSPHFQAIYRAGLENFANQTLEYAEKAHGVLDSIFPEGPEKTWIVIADHTDSLNGYALTFPFPHMVIYASAPQASSQLSPLDNWHYSVVLHEYVHIRHIYPTGGLWKILHAIFGSVIAPNGMMPSHLHEGIATFLETNSTKRGRGLGTPFKMYLRKAVEADVWGKDFAPLDLYDGSSRWPQGASAYFFGYLTYDELWKRKGKEGIRELTDAYSRNLPYFINRPLDQVFGLDYAKLWEDIYTRTTKAAQKELSDIKAKPLSTLSYLTSSRFHKKELLLSPDRKKLAFRSQTPDTLTDLNIYDLESRKIENRFTVTPSSGDGSCWLDDSGHSFILYLGNLSERFYQLSVLKAQTISGEDQALPDQLKELRHVQSIACSADGRSLWLVQSSPGHQLVRRFQWSKSLFSDVSENVSFELSGDTWVSALAPGMPGYFFTQDSIHSVLWRWGEARFPEKIGSFVGTTAQARVKSSSALEIVATIDTPDSVWELDLKSRRLKQIAAVTGGISETVSANENRFALSYEHGGYDLATVSGVDGVSRDLARAETFPTAEPTKYPDEDYSPWSSLTPKAWVPSMLVVPDGIQFGAWIPGFDIAQRHHYDIYAGYDSRGLPFGSLTYGHRFGGIYRFTGNINFTPSYFIASKSFFKTWGGDLGMEIAFPGSGFVIQAGPLFRRVESSRLGPANQSIGLETTVSYRNGLKTKPRGVSPGDGFRVFGTHQQYFRGLGSDDNYFTSILGADGYLDFPLIKNSVFYLGTRLGYTEGTALYNSFFNVGGELLFSQGKGTFLNRGYLNGYFAASRVFNTNLEYRFPIANIERGHGFFPAFLQRIHGALVFDASSLDRGVRSRYPDLFKVYYLSAGVELKTDWKLGYYLPAQLRIGAYHGFSPGGEDLYVTTAVEASL